MRQSGFYFLYFFFYTRLEVNLKVLQLPELPADSPPSEAPECSAHSASFYFFHLLRACSPPRLTHILYEYYGSYIYRHINLFAAPLSPDPIVKCNY